MAERAAAVPYSGVPSVEAGGGGGTPLNAHADAADFGGQIGGALQQAGQDISETATKFQGRLNETAMVNADAAFATKVGEIKGKYTSLTGSAAYNAFPQYQEDIKSAFQQARSGLPGGAQRGFDMMATRSMANHIADGSSYASSQLKEAQRDSYTNLANAQFSALLDPDIAASSERSRYHLDSLKYAAHAQVDEDHPGLTTDSDTGVVSFDESKPEGQALKAQVHQREDAYLSQGYVNRFDTLMKKDVTGAYDQYQKELDEIPRGAQVALDAKFASKLFDAHTQGASGAALQDAAQGHWQALTNPHSTDIAEAIHQQESSGKPHDYQIQPGTFAQYAKPGESFDNPADRDAVYGRIIDDLKKSYPDDPARQAVAYFSGKGNVSPPGSPEPYIHDYPDKRGKTTSSYVNDIEDRVGSTPVGKTYGTNANGAPLSTADYYALHKQDILSKGDAYAEQQMPGDLVLRRAVRQSLNNYMETAIQNQHVQYTMDNRNVMRAITGELTKGNPPGTEQELRAIPGIAPLLDKVAYQDPKFAETIPALISKAARQNVTTNSPNAYDTILRTLEPNDGAHPNGIFSQDHLDHMLGRTDGTGINMKDYKDAKQSVELPDKWKTFLSKNMQQIASANGNVDGKGQQRALAYYSAANELYKAKTEKGTVVADLVNPEGKDYVGISGNYMPSRAEQISNTAQNVRNGTQAQVPMFSSPNDPGFGTLAPGTRFRTADGQIRIKK